MGGNMRFSVRIAFFVIFLFAALFFAKRTVYAQSCGGSTTSTECRCSGGIPNVCQNYPVTHGCRNQFPGGPFTCGSDQTGCDNCSSDGINCTATNIYNGYTTSGCFTIAPPPTPGPTPTPGGGGGGGCGASCSDYCAGPSQCASQGGTTVGSRCSGGSCSPGTAPCACLGSSGGGGGGGGGGPTAICGQGCIVTSDCKPSCSGAPVYCNPTTHTCSNANCPNNTIPGCICACNGGLVCGQACAGGCTNNSICTFTDAPAGNCNSATYCIGDNPSDPSGHTTFDPNYVRNVCNGGGNSYLLYSPTGQTTGFTQTQINTTCPFATINVRAKLVPPSDIS